MPPAFSILIVMGNLCSKSLLGIPLFFGLFPFMCRPGIGTWLSSIHGNILFSHPRTQSALPLSLTLGTHTIEVYLVWTFLEEVQQDSLNRLEFVEMFIFVSSSLTKLMNFRQAFLVDSSLYPAHIYGAICIVVVIDSCDQCVKFVGKGSKLYTDVRYKKIQLKRILFRPHLSG